MAWYSKFKVHVLFQGEFEAMKTLSAWEAAHCDERPFRAKIKVSARTVFELSLFEKHEESRS